MKIIKQISQTSWYELICITNEWISESSSWLTHWILMIHWISQKSYRLTHWICHSSLDLFIQSFLSSLKYYGIFNKYLLSMQFGFVWGHLKHNPIINQTENKNEHSSPSSTVDLNLSISIRAWIYVGQLRNAPCDTECKIIPKCSEWGLFSLFLLTWCVKHGSVRRDKALPC